MPEPTLTITGTWDYCISIGNGVFSQEVIPPLSPKNNPNTCISTSAKPDPNPKPSPKPNTDPDPGCSKLAATKPLS